jgi:hypothetical protein
MLAPGFPGARIPSCQDSNLYSTYETLSQTVALWLRGCVAAWLVLILRPSYSLQRLNAARVFAKLSYDMADVEAGVSSGIRTASMTERISLS